MSSLSRILHLAAHSDTPIIIYDAATDTDFVLSRGDIYTDELLDREDDILEDWYDIERRSLIEDMDSEDLIDQINRDIAVWRAKDEQERRATYAEKLEHELIEEPLRDPFEEDFHHSTDWHSTADILDTIEIPDLSDSGFGDMYGGQSTYTTPESFVGLQSTAPSALSWEDASTASSEWSPAYPLETVADTAPEPIQLQEVPFDAPMPEELVNEQPLIDDGTPVFYDEPVM
jgi:hypothetical protein